MALVILAVFLMDRIRRRMSLSDGTQLGPLSLWERAGVRVAYEDERVRSFAPLTRAARGLSQRERRSPTQPLAS